MVPLPPAEPPEFNAFETVVRLSHSQNQRDLLNDIQTQTASNAPIITNSNICNTPTANITQPRDQSTIIWKQFSMITEELKDFTNKVSGDITKIIQAYNTAQENTDKLIENAISQTPYKSTKYHYHIFFNRY